MIPAIVIAGRREPWFGGHAADVAIGEVSIVGKTVIEHTLDDLARAGIREAVVLTPDADQLRHRSSDWPPELAVEVVSEHGEPDARIDSWLRRWGRDVLVVRGDVLRSGVIDWFLPRALSIGGDVYLTIEGLAAGVQLVGRGNRVRDRGIGWTRESLTRGTACVCPHARVFVLESAHQYYAALVEAMAGRIRHLQQRGEPLQGDALVGRGACVQPCSIVGPGVVVDRDAHVASTARLGLHAFVGEGAVVDHRASIQYAVVLPRTYVDAEAVIRRAVVGPDAVVDIDTNHCTPRDGRLPADTIQTRFRQRLDDVANRLLALGLWLLLSPVWLVALAALASRGRPVLVRRSFVSNRAFRSAAGELYFDTFRLRVPRVAAAAPAMASWLWAAVRGHVRIVGATPVELNQLGEQPTSAPDKPGTDGLGDPGDAGELRDAGDVADIGDVPAGVFGPAWQARLRGIRSPQGHAQLAADYAHRRTAAQDIRLVWEGVRSLADRDAWRERPVTNPVPPDRHQPESPSRAA